MQLLLHAHASHRLYILLECLCLCVCVRTHLEIGAHISNKYCHKYITNLRRRRTSQPQRRASYLPFKSVYRSDKRIPAAPAPDFGVFLFFCFCFSSLYFRLICFVCFFVFFKFLYSCFQSNI